MKNHNDQAMESYFNSMLLSTPVSESEVKNSVENVNNRLENLQPTLSTLPETLQFSEPEKNREVKVAPVATGNTITDKTQEWRNLQLESEFQVLFFALSGLTFAVPLTELGGIHQLDSSLNYLIGKPVWFSGVMTHNDSLFNIVDTAQWINTGQSRDSLNYSHYVLLGSTDWGLSCEKLLGTETLTTEQVKWRSVEGKRPWLAGMVIDKMCALIHVEELVKLLNSGMNIHGH